MAVIRLQGETEKEKGVFYQLDTNEKPIGVGGMGQVFKGICVDECTGATKPVAIKFMFDDLPAHAIERARREASIQLRNDNLVEMLGFIEIPEKDPSGEVKMRYHVVSELLTGVSLSDLLEGKTTDRDGKEVPFAIRMLQDYKNDSEHFARTVVTHVLSGLMALHDAGYIHRDIDPSNIMLTDDNHIKLIDFGIAKKMSTLTTHDKELTVAGNFMGKPAYAAPELVLGDIQHQNQTTDIYAVGILLYLCIIGHTPFEGPRHEVLEKQLKSKLPLGVIRNRAMRNIIATACDKKQALRYQTSAQMRVALETMDDEPVGMSSRTKMIIGAVAAAILIFIGVFVMMKPSDSAMEKPVTAVMDTLQTEHNGDIQMVTNHYFDSALGVCSYTGPMDADEKPHGIGEASFTDGRLYKGPFIHGKMEGKKAFFRYDNGDTFEGTFMNNSFSEGRYSVKSDGSYFVGKFKNGQPDEGIWYDKKGNKI